MAIPGKLVPAGFIPTVGCPSMGYMNYGDGKLQLVSCPNCGADTNSLLGTGDGKTELNICPACFELNFGKSFDAYHTDQIANPPETT